MKRQLTWLAFALGILSVAPADARVLELTFDDAEAGDSSPARNAQERLLGPIELADGAVRTALGEGYYGRGLRLASAEAHVQLSQLDEAPTIWGFAMWVNLDGTSTDGWLFDVSESIGVRVVGNELAFSHDVGGTLTDELTGAMLPADGWHHVYVEFDPGVSEVRVWLDFSPAGTAPLISPGEPSDLVMSFGRGLTATIDELVVYDALEDDWMFDWSPTMCADGVECVEEVITTTPDGMTREVPVRMKAMWDDAQCPDGTTCPLLIVVSGGGTCANDYAPSGITRLYASAGFFVVTVDPTCEVDRRYELFPHEVSQLVAAKDHAMTAWRDRIEGDDYYAEGCSHGANVLALWTFRGDDVPARSFARSADMSVACGYHHVLCEDTRELSDAVLLGASTPHPLESEEALWLWRNWEMTQYVTPEVASRAEFAASWGVDTSPETPTCQDGVTTCYEEGYGFPYSGRRMRDLWRVMEPADRRTGYFFEYSGEDCQHCGIGDNYNCVSCFLHLGVEGMAAEPGCAACLDLDEGAESEACGLHCDDDECTFDSARDDRDSWGEASDMGVADMGGSPDGGDGGVAPPLVVNPTDDEDGCSCSVTPAASPFWVLLFLGFLGSRRRRVRSCQAPVAERSR